MKPTTETEEPTTVAVPVALLRTILTDYGPENYVWQQVTPLLPKPKPRLVAVPDNFRDWHDQPNQTSEEYLAAQPNLLTLLDEAIDSIPWLVTDDHDSKFIKTCLRTALGVTE